MQPPATRPLARRLAAGAALDTLVRTIAGDLDTDDSAALAATRAAEMDLVAAAMRDADVAVVDTGGRYTVTLFGRVARSDISADAARLNWARAARRDWIAHRTRLTSIPVERTPR